MLVQLRIPTHIKEAIDRLVVERLYPDFNSAAVVALENLLVAEVEHASGKLSQAEQRAPVSGGLSVFDWNGAPETRKVHPLVSSHATPGQAFHIERWLFGQRNRLLPLKVNARLLLLEWSSTAETSLQVLSDKIALKAAKVGGAFAKIDLERKHKKEDLLATGFPSEGSDKSAQRYAEQFVASENKRGDVTGMMTDWAMAVVERGSGTARLEPTDACVAFASMPNPLLDAQGTKSNDAKFSDQELEWALLHLKRHVAVEVFTFRTLLQGIETGANDPTKLDEYLHREKLVGSPKTTREFVGTQRSGAISRMADLGLIRRVRDGVRISYELTDRASAFSAA